MAWRIRSFPVKETVSRSFPRLELEEALEAVFVDVVGVGSSDATDCASAAPDSERNVVGMAQSEKPRRLNRRIFLFVFLLFPSSTMGETGE